MQSRGRIAAEAVVCRLPQTGDTKRLAIMWPWSMGQITHFWWSAGF